MQGLLYTAIQSFPVSLVPAQHALCQPWTLVPSTVLCCNSVTHCWLAVLHVAQASDPWPGSVSAVLLLVKKGHCLCGHWPDDINDMPFTTLLSAQTAEWYKAYHLCHQRRVQATRCGGQRWRLQGRPHGQDGPGTTGPTAILRRPARSNEKW